MDATKSYEVLKQVMGKIGVKAVAAEMGLSESLVYKWSQEPAGDDREKSGARNPLDRVIELYRLTGDPAILVWLCAQAGGMFVENPQGLKPEKLDSTVIRNTQVMIKEFSDLLNEISDAINDARGIEPHEAQRIRREWEELKRKSESFVVGCESGLYTKP
jgi:hypothetical protein